MKKACLVRRCGRSLYQQLTLNLCCAVFLVALSCPTLCNPMNCSTPGSSVHGILQARILQWVAMPSSRGSSQPRDSLLFGPPRKPMNPGMGSSLFLLQGNFPTQESNWSLLDCRRILYQLSYQGTLIFP